MPTRLFRNLPNLLTVLRLTLVPFVVRELWRGNYRLALVLLFVAGATDALDGYLARRFNWTSRFGAYLDPVGDKLLLVSVYLVLGLKDVVPRWLMWLVLGRDALILTMVAIALLFTQVRSFPPSIWGKLSTVIQIGAGLGIIAANGYFPVRPPGFDQAIVLVTALATGVSGLHYLWLAGNRLRRDSL